MQNRKIPQIIHEKIKTRNRSYQVSKGWTPVRVMKNGLSSFKRLDTSESYEKWKLENRMDMSSHLKSTILK